MYTVSHGKINLFLPWLILLLAVACSSSDEIKNPLVVNPEPVKSEDFAAMNWQEKVEHLRLFKTAPRRPENKELFHQALANDSVGVKLAAMKILISFRGADYREKITGLIDHEDPMVRWHTMIYLENIPVKNSDLDLIAQRFRDEEWLVRESAFRSIRRYAFELKRKKYLVPMMFTLSESNANVLRQIYRTLRWYNDRKVFPFLFKRSYHTKSNIELLIVMQELSYYKTSKVYRRLRQIAAKDNEGFIRHEAEKLLADF